MLSQINPHPRDNDIKFDSVLHKYTVNSDPEYISVTTFIKQYFEKFDPDTIARNMVKNKNFKTDPKYAKYQFGLEGEELIQKIVSSWTDYGKQVSGEGTTMHNNIENYYNDNKFDHNNQLFKIYDDAMNEKGYKPYRTEFMIYDEDFKIAGCVDMLYYHPERKTYHMVDWKRSKKIEFKGYKKALYPISHLDDCNGIHYTLQLNLYKFILEKNYNINIYDMKLVILHPDNHGIIEIGNHQNDIVKLLSIKK